MRLDRLFDEVHRIAGRYHWEEPQILALSWRRRQRYLNLIEREWAESLTQYEGDG